MTTFLPQNPSSSIVLEIALCHYSLKNLELLSGYIIPKESTYLKKKIP